MDTLKHSTKIGIITAAILLVSVLHYGSGHEGIGGHIVHRELYFIPILLSAFWFGLFPGLATSVAISIIYAPQAFSDTHSGMWPIVFQIVMFNLVALILGYLIERGRIQHAKMIAANKSATLGLAATAIGHEMKSLLGALKSIANRNAESKNMILTEDFEGELNRLEQLVEIISTFDSEKSLHLLSHDLNQIVQEKIQQHTAAANKTGVSFKVDLDENGCPSLVDADLIGRVFDRVIDNALEASSKKQSIHIQTVRKADHCEVVIADKGQGIKPEHLPKLFKPFFTTKEGRDGLSLSASYKMIKDMGGDIIVQSEYGKGAKFTVLIPREDSANRLKEELRR